MMTHTYVCVHAGGGVCTHAGEGVCTHVCVAVVLTQTMPWSAVRRC